jgi:hypothetical protein
MLKSRDRLQSRPRVTYESWITIIVWRLLGEHHRVQFPQAEDLRADALRYKAHEIRTKDLLEYNIVRPI